MSDEKVKEEGLHVSIMVISHNKPAYLADALNSILAQSYTNYDVVIVDSGKIADGGILRTLIKNHDKWVLLRTEESPDQHTKSIMSSWVINRFTKELKGDLLMYLCDDDILYQNCFEEFVNAKMMNPDWECMYSGQHIIHNDGTTDRIVGTRLPNDIAGQCVGGSKLDCVVDYLQFCCTRKAMDKYIETYGPIIQTEDLSERWHADGLLLENFGKLFPIYPVNKILSANRRTPLSVNIK